MIVKETLRLFSYANKICMFWIEDKILDDE
jgi:hypothetical protein